ncbi:hypothetical protein AB0O34_18215 [Sphaerisporangium sp. NPDC088356]|uniref:hypothetical protein n=1 Tax=Sphaerisporangium sp. NPDC088356 TaxID=3154871 RepID=UPI00343777B8
MSAHNSRRASRFVSAVGATGASQKAAPARAGSSSFTVSPAGTNASLPPMRAAGGNTPWG